MTKHNAIIKAIMAEFKQNNKDKRIMKIKSHFVTEVRNLH